MLVRFLQTRLPPQHKTPAHTRQVVRCLLWVCSRNGKNRTLRAIIKRGLSLGLRRLHRFYASHELVDLAGAPACGIGEAKEMGLGNLCPPSANLWKAAQKGSGEHL